ncbi:MAG: DivIVA domain-containing protein [Acidimicrobiia bacterium]|nr:DivIVA domain-containing protein [Acidimicrobiia bacterium]
MDSLASRVTGAEFPLVKRGYDPDAVDSFIEGISTSIVALEEELSVAKAKAVKLEERLRSTSDADTVVQTAFLAAAEAKAKLLQEAEARGAEIVAAAEAKAAEIAADITTEDGSPDAARAIEHARARAGEIEAQALALLDEARREAETLVSDAQRVAAGIAVDDDDPVVTRTDAAREELHRIMWLLKTVKQAVHTGLVAAQEEAPELELVLNDQVDLGQIQPSEAAETRI